MYKVKVQSSFKIRFFKSEYDKEKTIFNAEIVQLKEALLISVMKKNMIN